MKINEAKIKVLLSETPPNCEAILAEFDNLIRYVALRNGWEKYYDDVSQEARLAIVLAARNDRFDHKRGTVYAFFYRVIRNAMALWMRTFVYGRGFEVDNEFPLKNIASCQSDTIHRATKSLTKTRSHLDKARIRMKYSERILGLPIADIVDICRSAERSLLGTPMEMLLDILSPRQLAQLIFVFSNMSLRVPGFATIIKPAIRKQK